MSKKEAQNEALRIAKEKLSKIDLAGHCAKLQLSPPEKGIIHIRAFGKDMILTCPEFDLFLKEENIPAKTADHILILHYLLHDKPIFPASKLISFRELTGGQFYWQPFLSRTAEPLIKAIANNIELLEKNITRFDWAPVKLGDFGAEVHALGKIFITLAYHRGDHEFPPAIDVLFDECIKDVFGAEDAAVIASRICLGLI